MYKFYNVSNSTYTNTQKVYFSLTENQEMRESNVLKYKLDFSNLTEKNLKRLMKKKIGSHYYKIPLIIGDSNGVSYGRETAQGMKESVFEQITLEYYKCDCQGYDSAGIWGIGRCPDCGKIIKPPGMGIGLNEGWDEVLLELFPDGAFPPYGEMRWFFD
jgi:hypothetical protein